MKPALLSGLIMDPLWRLIQWNSMEFNGVRPVRNIQFDLAGDLRLGRCKLNLRPASCKQSTGKTIHPN